MTTQRSLSASSEAPRRGASRPTIILGFACIGGLVGIITGAFVGASALGMELPDHADYLPLFMMISAGAGWLVGALFGSVLGSDARPPGAVGRRLLIAGAVAVVLGATVIVLWPVPSGWPEGGVTLFSIWSAEGGTEFELAVAMDAALVVITLLAGGTHHERTGSGHPGRVVGATGIAGLVVGGLTFSLAIGLVAYDWSETLARQKYRAVQRTTGSLVSAAADKHGSRKGLFPTNLEELLAAGGKVRPGTQVEFVGVVNGAFCVVVGVDLGDGRTGDPHFVGQAYQRPPGANSWTSSDGWEGDSCTQE